MFALLPDLSPHDSHSLWYTSSRNPFPAASGAHDGHGHGHGHGHGIHHEHGHGNNPGHGPHGSHRRGAAHLLIERSPLARLRADEQNLERRRQNVTNFGSAWLKPPGLPKTLHQLREERREAEEHQEAMRREQLAQELAEAAEADAAGTMVGDTTATGTGGTGVMPDALQDGVGGGDDGMDDVQLDGTRDLDDDIPEADAADFGLSDNEDEDEEDDDEEDEEDEEEEDEDEEDAEEREMRAAHAQQQQLMAQRMRQANDAFREDMVRGRDAAAAFYGADEDIDDEDQSQMIEEDDLLHHRAGHDLGDEDGIGMDADLDDDIPEAESMGGYEHTDTEAELTTTSGGSGRGLEEDEDEDDDDEGMDEDNDGNERSHLSLPPSRHTDRFRHSLAISDILSRDGSSILDSSPVMPRRGPGFRRG